MLWWPECSQNTVLYQSAWLLEIMEDVCHAIKIHLILNLGPGCCSGTEGEGRGAGGTGEATRGEGGAGASTEGGWGGTGPVGGATHRAVPGTGSGDGQGDSWLGGCEPSDCQQGPEPWLPCPHSPMLSSLDLEPSSLYFKGRKRAWKPMSQFSRCTNIL